MPALQELQRQIKSAADLHTVVRTMKALAAVSIRQYEEAVRALEDYYATVELGLRAVLHQRPLARTVGPPAESVVLLLGSDQGMAGRFNEALIDFAADQLEESAGPFFFWVAGDKAAGSVTDRLGAVEESFAMPSSVQTITAVVQDVLLRFETRRRERGECRLLLMHNTPSGGAVYGQRSLQLLPPDSRWLAQVSARHWPGRSLPLFRAPWEVLFAALIREYLFVSLFSSLAFSLAAENAARLASMQRAEKNIEELQEELAARYHSLRQTVITEELFDIVAGFEAQSGRMNRKTAKGDR
jgi:F-type H+-transporting ATPase subunit gamma